MENSLYGATVIVRYAFESLLCGEEGKDWENCISIHYV
jgi:hypothetical protein